jgi:hypothetical protein
VFDEVERLSRRATRSQHAATSQTVAARASDSKKAMKENTVGNSVMLGGVTFWTDGTSAWTRRFGKGAGGPLGLSA